MSAWRTLHCTDFATYAAHGAPTGSCPTRCSFTSRRVPTSSNSKGAVERTRAHARLASSDRERV